MLPCTKLGKRIEQEGPLKLRFLIFLQANSPKPFLWNQINLAPLQISWLCPPLLLNQAACHLLRSPSLQMTPWRHFCLFKSSGSRPGKVTRACSLHLVERRRVRQNSTLPEQAHITYAMGKPNPKSKTWLEAHKVGFFMWTKNTKHSLN